jgi:hypothetical protein
MHCSGYENILTFIGDSERSGPDILRSAFIQQFIVDLNTLQHRSNSRHGPLVLGLSTRCSWILFLLSIASCDLGQVH